MLDWEELASQREERYRDGQARVAGISDRDQRQRQLTRMGNAAGAAGLAHLMAGRDEEARAWFRRAAGRYRESWEDAPPESWGRPIGAIKALLLADAWGEAQDAAAWPLDAGALTSQSPIGRYAACLALLVLGRDAEGREVAATLGERDDFPSAVADALATIAAGDRAGYIVATEQVLDSFERRDEYLEDVPVADTLLVLQALARQRGLDVELRASALLPGPGQRS
jgi:hypothetical protein